MNDVLEILLGLALGAIIMYWVFSYIRSRSRRELTQHQSTVILEKIRSVCKLITVEGDFAEIYRYENTRSRFMSMISSKKRALIVIKAKAQIGYDLKKLFMHADNEKKKIILENFPAPEVLTIEPELEFYDIKNGIFNAFTPDDLTSLNKEARKHILEKIPESGLMETANKEALEAVLLIEKIVETIGWTLDYSALEFNKKQLKNKND
ncbi:DUF4230 domain-containing protein [Zeaxanthinibacter enoshimensis]|uniref:Uncharacterized protein DUF4230 n=1 Tax=Zeaxanthinibacter enoshimensis TaxID=392009 RepID=A0A4R6TTU3_9FLAO|nr:DUF4230 domain-containing protein [Zeaxanthinibacter enoshimensis]TDQ32368.1 uncharacterized protein DUF4230 [Zeaxanthinibacter enoshimensis]